MDIGAPLPKFAHCFRKLHISLGMIRRRQPLGRGGSSLPEFSRHHPIRPEYLRAGLCRCFHRVYCFQYTRIVGILVCFYRMRMMRPARRYCYPRYQERFVRIAWRSVPILPRRERTQIQNCRRGFTRCRISSLSKFLCYWREVGHAWRLPPPVLKRTLRNSPYPTRNPRR